MSAKQKPSGWVPQPLVLFPEVAGSLWAVSATAFWVKLPWFWLALLWAAAGDVCAS